MAGENFASLPSAISVPNMESNGPSPLDEGFNPPEQSRDVQPGTLSDDLNSSHQSVQPAGETVVPQVPSSATSGATQHLSTMQDLIIDPALLLPIPTFQQGHQSTDSAASGRDQHDSVGEMDSMDNGKGKPTPSTAAPAMDESSSTTPSTSVTPTTNTPAAPTPTSNATSTNTTASARQIEAAQRFLTEYPHGARSIPTSGQGLRCGLFAVINMIRRLNITTGPPPTMRELLEIVEATNVTAQAQLFGNLPLGQVPDETLRSSLLTDTYLNTDQLDNVVREYGRRRNCVLRLGWIQDGDVRDMAMRGTSDPNETMVWVHYDPSGMGHFSAIQHPGNQKEDPDDNIAVFSQRALVANLATLAVLVLSQFESIPYRPYPNVLRGTTVTELFWRRAQRESSYGTHLLELANELKQVKEGPKGKKMGQNTASDQVFLHCGRRVYYKLLSSESKEKVASKFTMKPATHAGADPFTNIEHINQNFQSIRDLQSKPIKELKDAILKLWPTPSADRDKALIATGTAHGTLLDEPILTEEGAKALQIEVEAERQTGKASKTPQKAAASAKKATARVKSAKSTPKKATGRQRSSSATLAIPQARGDGSRSTGRRLLRRAPSTPVTPSRNAGGEDEGKKNADGSADGPQSSDTYNAETENRTVPVRELKPPSSSTDLATVEASTSTTRRPRTPQGTKRPLSDMKTPSPPTYTESVDTSIARIRQIPMRARRIQHFSESMDRAAKDANHEAAALFQRALKRETDGQGDDEEEEEDDGNGADGGSDGEGPS